MNRDLTEGSVAGHVFRLAWPTALAMGLQTAFNIVDAIFVSRVGQTAIAAVSMVFPALMLMFAVSVGLGVGTTSLIARLLGSGEHGRASSAATHSFLLAGVFSVVFCTAGMLLQSRLFLLLGATPTLLPVVLDYSTWIFPGCAFLFFFTAAASVLRAEGDMKTPMVVMVIAVLLNAVLDPLLIFGIGFFPRLEVEGAAIATFISRAAGCVLIMLCLFRGKTAVRVKWRGFRWRAGVARDILWVGVPASMNHVTMSVGFGLLIRIISGFGEAAVAAYGLVIRLNQIAILPCLGIATAVIALVGHNVGARKFDRAAATAWKAALFAVITMEAIGIVFFAFPSALMRMFINEPEVIAHGVQCLRTISLTYMFIGLGIIVGSAFQGAGKGVPALVITTLRLIVLAVPAAYFLSRSYGLAGVWAAIAGSSVLAGLVSALWFSLGTWRRPSLPEQAVP